MKKLLIVIAVIASGCGPSAEERAAIEKTRGASIPYSLTTRGVSVLDIDACQYIYCETPYGVSITHKQNCKYCKQRNP